MTNTLSLKVEEIVTEIDMSHEIRPWLIVEGPSDEIFFSTKNLPNNPKSVSAFGWKNVVGVVAKVLEENISDVTFGFIDRDYREELGNAVTNKMIVHTDFRDLEISMFESGALHKILVELGSNNKLPSLDCGSVNLEVIKEKIYRVASKMGALRYYSLKNGYNYRLKELNFSKFISQQNLEIDTEKLVNQINPKSETKITIHDVETAFELELPDRLTDSKNICCGHDVIELLAIALRKLWGSNNSIKKETLESSFRIGYSDDEFYKSEMYKQLAELFIMNGVRLD